MDTKLALMNDVERAVIKLATFHGMPQPEAVEYARQVAIAAQQWASHQGARRAQV